MIKLRTIIVFGPPGSGKTTMTGQLGALLHWRTCDLEVFHDVGLRAQVCAYLARRLADSKEQVIGAAGETTALVSWTYAFKVLLLPNRANYHHLLDIRFKYTPSKLGQDEWNVYDEMEKAKDKFDFVLTNPNFQEALVTNGNIIIRKYYAWLSHPWDAETVEKALVSYPRDSQKLYKMNVTRSSDADSLAVHWSCPFCSVRNHTP
jgi:hypothetical protein